MKQIKLLFFLLCLSASFLSKTQAQVGVGTTNPTAKLEIDAASDAIPALEIVPRTTAPTGTADGQIAMIDNSLYIFDSVRNKWLSSETIVLTGIGNGATEGQYLNINSVNSGFSLPFNATLVGITVRATGGGDTSRTFRIRKNGSATNVQSFVVNNYSYTGTGINLNFDAGDYVNIYIESEAGDIDNPVVNLFFKWRK